MKEICVVTGTRAEYGLLKSIIIALDKTQMFQVRLVVTGSHLSPEYGLTFQEIQSDGIEIARKIEILLSSDTSVGISKSMGLALISFAEYFAENRPDAVMLLGDRYEALAAACAAVNANIPIVHLHGGETTQGAVDEAYRHAITKMSYLHFTSTEEYRQRVIQLGENPNRVFNVGAVGVENALKMPLISKNELENSLGCILDRPYAVVTFHPVTLEDRTCQIQVQELFKALNSHKEMIFIFTKANADAGGRIMNQMLDKYAQQHKNTMIFESLGSIRYLSAVKYAAMVIGNSSSGIIEVPSFGIPTINIGDRQKGRIQAKSIINCEPLQIEIEKAIRKALSTEFLLKIKDIDNPYGDGNVTDKVIHILIDKLVNDKVDLKKEFWDL